MVKHFASLVLAVWVVAFMSLVSPALGHHRDGHGPEPTPTATESVEPTPSPEPSPSVTVPRVLPSCLIYWIAPYYACYV